MVGSAASFLGGRIRMSERAKQPCAAGAFLLAAALLLPALPAMADPLDVGEQLYQAMDYEAARAALLQAATLPDARRRAEAYVYLGLIDTIDGDDAAALRAFRSGLALDLDLALPAGTSPKVAGLFDRARGEVARASPPPPRAPPPAPAPAALPPRLAAPGPAAAPVPAQALGESGTPPEVAAGGPTSHANRWVAGALLVLGLAAAGAAIDYGVQEQSAERAFAAEHWQNQAALDRTLAIEDATIANVLYVTAAALGATSAAFWFAF